MLRAILDSNILTRSVLSKSGASAWVVQSFKQRQFILITARQQADEVYRVLGYARLRRKHPALLYLRKKLVGSLLSRGVVLSPPGHLHICRDPRDDYLIELALMSEPDYLVTEDIDVYGDPAVVRALAEEGVAVARVAEFAQRLRQTLR